MAEAAVEEIPTAPARYYCHGCSSEFDEMNPGYVCPNCACGFVEELDPPVEMSAEENGQQNDQENEGPSFFDDPVGNLVSSLFPGSRNHHNSERGTSAGTGGSGTSTHHQHYPPLVNFLHDLVSSAGGAHLVQSTTTMTVGGEAMMVSGNMANYIWSREGLDQILNYFLNQSVDPQPLEPEQISTLPTIKITSEQTSVKLRCSICWEHFKEDEMVRQLLCSHIYHDECIFPWLQMHATCPICRSRVRPRSE